ncbi:MAG: peptidylprolyl isomerase [Rhodobacterales bacterium RIFCSPHIGHO2_02_FULL_62_130]|nr:MAG: peptidylprolyl isomerase [Rhodobacterales bacterium RIFCSPHIGHO2_02_FULL_62_130]OHC56841.1 MAG: peptidylprolyl isomerase [Rhodobacterales bacterium RIFCSPHIGHO2_12_FULL_62_75]HCZ00369.1 peptidylprolyl isomerase [Rhodobacter sp.]
MAKAMRFLAGMALSMGLALPVLAQEPAADTVVAVVNGTNITLGHMIVARESLPEQYKTLPNEVLFKGILDQLIQQTALEQSLADKITKAQTIQIENDRRGYLSNIALEAVVSTAVTDTALQAAYDARFKDAAPQTEYSAAHILVDSEEKANELKTQLDGGADFAELAKANSTDTGSGANGGDLGWFGLGMMVKPFEEAVVAAEIGKVAGPIKTDFGFHLILVNETRVAAQPTLDDLRDELASEIEQAAVEAYVKSLTDAATVEKPGEGIDPAVLSDLTLLDK